MSIPTLKNYTTKIPAERTASQIIEILAKHGASQVMQDFDDGHIAGISWAVETPHGRVAFKMPVDVDKCHAVLMSQGVATPRQTTPANYEHSRKVAWRIVKDWVEVQLALLRTEMVTLDQVMLPYAVGRDGRTLYQHMIDGGYDQFAALPQGS